MNAGKDVFTLMRAIKLPPALESARAMEAELVNSRIYEGYVGYFD